MKLSLLACTLLAVSASAKTTLYLSPSSSSPSGPISVDASEANEVLSHHLDVVHRGFRTGRKHIWDHTLQLDAAQGELEIDQRAMVERLFDGAGPENKNRLMILMHGATDPEVAPASLRATHQLEASPSSISFDALLGSYVQDLQSSLRISDAAFDHLGAGFLQGLGSLAAGVEHAFEGAASWLMGSSSAAAHKAAASSTRWWKELERLVGAHKHAALDALQAELEAVHGLIDRIASDSVDRDALAFQPLRLQAVGDVKAAFGADSDEFAKARAIVREAIDQLVEAFEARSRSQGRESSIALVFNEAEVRLAKRSSAAESTLLEPFLGRASNLNGGIAIKPLKANKGGAKLVGACFASQDELEKATSKCSGHGRAAQSSTGGRKCWKCQCSATKNKGRTTYWAGAACEKKDLSSEVVLLGTTGLVLVLISLGSVYFLYSAGNAELPGTLAGVTINLK